MPLTTLDRRALLKALAVAPAVALSLPRGALAEAQAAGLIATDVCLLQPEVTEGPFYLDTGLLREDITEGRPGLPMVLRLQVVGVDCTPVSGARVDVWHCDAAGAYSGVEGAGGTFLRGIGFTAADGVATFRTIFPGWYRGRTTHIHFKVILGDRDVLTGQVFFDQTLADTIHAEHDAYEARGLADTRNEADRIARAAGQGSVCALRLPEPDGEAEAALVIGIDPDGKGTGLLNRLLGRG